MASPTTVPAAFTPEAQQKVLEVLRTGMSQSEVLQACKDMSAGPAVLLIVAGVIFLLWGYYSFKALVTINAAIIGGWLGALIGEQGGAPVPAALIGAFTAAAVTWPLMRYAVAIMGGLIGACIGVSIWRTTNLNPDFALSGGGMGLIFFGMLSFILFRTSVMMFTSLQGSIMLIFGLLGVLYKFNSIDSSMIDSRLTVSPFIMPMTVFFASVMGILYQTHHTGEPEPAKKK